MDFTASIRIARLSYVSRHKYTLDIGDYTKVFSA